MTHKEFIGKCGEWDALAKRTLARMREDSSYVESTEFLEARLALDALHQEIMAVDIRDIEPGMAGKAFEWSLLVLSCFGVIVSTALITQDVMGGRMPWINGCGLLIWTWNYFSNPIWKRWKRKRR